MDTATELKRFIALTHGYSVQPTDEDKRLAEQAKTFQVKKIPYAGERSHLKYDRRNHSGRGRHPDNSPFLVGERGSIAYSDYENGFHIKQFATANEMRLLYTPTFAKNDEQLKLVLAQQAYSYARSWVGCTKEFYGGGERIPNGFLLNLDALQALVAKATEAARQATDNTLGHYKHLAMCDAHGGYLALRTRIAYMAWRESLDSATIGQELGLNWVAVRQILHRLCETALRLGLETFPRHHSCFGKLPRPLDSPRVNTLEARANTIDGLSAKLLAGEISAFELAAHDKNARWS